MFVCYWYMPAENGHQMHSVMMRCHDSRIRKPFTMMRTCCVCYRTVISCTSLCKMYMTYHLYISAIFVISTISHTAHHNSMDYCCMLLIRQTVISAELWGFNMQYSRICEVMWCSLNINQLFIPAIFYYRKKQWLIKLLFICAWLCCCICYI